MNLPIPLLQRIMEMDNVKMCIGNHEYDFLRYIGYPYNNETPSNEDYFIYQIANPTVHEPIVRLPYLVGDDLIYAFNDLPLQDRTKIIFYLRSLPVEYRISINSKNDKILEANPGLKICSKNTVSDYKWHYSLAHASTSWNYINAKAALKEKNVILSEELGEFCTNNNRFTDGVEPKTTVVVAHTPVQIKCKAKLDNDRIIISYTDKYESMNIPSIENVISLECHHNHSVCRRTVGCIRLDDMNEFYVQN